MSLKKLITWTVFIFALFLSGDSIFASEAIQVRGAPNGTVILREGERYNLNVTTPEGKVGYKSTKKI